MTKTAPNPWALLADFVREHLGLHYPPERRVDLRRGFARVASDFGCTDEVACIERLLSSPPSAERLQVLAAHLTIGETYFFRDRAMIAALEQSVLPALIRGRRGRWQHLRVWSAGCCSGEEAYTLAIIVHRLLPDRTDWQIAIAATDLNARFLHKASAAAYGEWSFRDTPPDIKRRYFERGADGRYTLIPAIRRMVHFRQLNLVADAWPSPASGIGACDLILCRNVLMYFAPMERQKVADRLIAALAPGGWLALSPSESSHALFPSLEACGFPGAILFRKPPVGAGVSAFPAPAGGRVAAAVAALPTAEAPAGPHTAAELGRHAKALADQGRLGEALDACACWLAADKLDASAHCLRAAVLLERDAEGDLEQARHSLRRALYLQHDLEPARALQDSLSRGTSPAPAALRTRGGVSA